MSGLITEIRRATHMICEDSNMTMCVMVYVLIRARGVWSITITDKSERKHWP